ncbi:alpha/beta fold hydrolase [Geodermatophilus sp. SYSU D01176]
MRESLLSSRPRALAATTFASLSHDGVELAPALDVPALVLHGDADPEVPAEEAQALMTALPDAELVRLPAAEHMLPLTHGGFVAEQIARWVARTARTTTPGNVR